MTERCIEHYRAAKTPNDLIAAANNDAVIAVMLGAELDDAYKFIELAEEIAAEKGWKLSEDGR